MLGTVLAQSSFQLQRPQGLPDIFASAGEAIPRLWHIGVIVASILFMVLLLAGGLMYLTAGGSEDATKKAKALLVDAVIGLVLVVIAWPVGKWVIAQLGNPGNVFENPAGQATLGGASGGSSSSGSGSGSGTSTGGIQKDVRPVSVKLTERGSPAVQKTFRAVSKDGLKTFTATTDSTGGAVLEFDPNVYDFYLGDELLGTRTISEGTGETAVSFNIVAPLRGVTVAPVDSKTFAPLANYSFRIWRDALAGQPELITTVTTDSSGKVAVDLPAEEVVFATPANGTADLGSYSVPDQEATAWTLLVPASTRQ